jgi:hypothetical protein
MLVPISFGPPAVFVLIPPAVLLAPTAFSRRVQFATFVIGLAAVASMVLDGLMEIMLSMSHPALAAVDILRVKPRKSCKDKHCHQDRA